MHPEVGAIHKAFFAQSNWQGLKGETYRHREGQWPLGPANAAEAWVALRGSLLDCWSRPWDSSYHAYSPSKLGLLTLISTHNESYLHFDAIACQDNVEYQMRTSGTWYHTPVNCMAPAILISRLSIIPPQGMCWRGHALVQTKYLRVNKSLMDYHGL